MKDGKDQGTGDMFGVKRKRGRPKTGTAKSGAERQAAYRAKQAENTVTVTFNRTDVHLLKHALSIASVEMVENGRYLSSGVDLAAFDALVAHIYASTR